MYKKMILAATALLVGSTALAWKIEGRIAGVADKDSISVMIFRY